MYQSLVCKNQSIFQPAKQNDMLFSNNNCTELPGKKTKKKLAIRFKLLLNKWIDL